MIRSLPRNLVLDEEPSGAMLSLLRGKSSAAAHLLRI
jgi:hypothetical protein